MRKVPRQRERTATPAELDDERQRWIRATVKVAQPSAAGITFGLFALPGESRRPQSRAVRG